MTRKAVAAVALAVFTTLLLSAGVAQAHWMSGTKHKHWYSKSDPLTAWDDGKKRAEAYGWSWKRTSTGDLMNHPHFRDVRRDGFPVFAETRYSFYTESWMLGGGWTGRKYKDQSTRVGVNKGWVNEFDRQSYTDCYWCQDAHKARVWSRVCVDRDRLRPDWCSKWTYKGFRV